jgi:hypothetical protein
MVFLSLRDSQSAKDIENLLIPKLSKKERGIAGDKQRRWSIESE